MANSCGTCKHYQGDAAFNLRSGICEWPMPPWVLAALRRADMRCQIVGQSEGAHCQMWTDGHHMKQQP